MPPTPKPAATRQRRNKVAGMATLRPVADLETPELPAHPGEGWHDLTVRWWDDLWSSPMAPEYDTSDIHGLFMLAVLVDGFWWAPSKELAAEIRLQRQAFGLSPIDRRRLQWEIDRGEQAEESRTKRKTKPRPAKDPRESLSA